MENTDIKEIEPNTDGQSVEQDNPTVRERLSDMEVIEHTANIWQYKEITDDNTELHSEYHQKRTETPFGEILGARVRGKKHKHDGSNCDDFFETAVTDDCFIAAVCDGAGSRRLSRIGSRAASERAAAFLKDSLERLFLDLPEIRSGLSADLKSAEFMAACTRIAQLVQKSAREAYDAQDEAAKKLSDDENYEKSLGRKPVTDDLAATFLAAVVVPLEINGERQNFMACVQIGDGCICSIDSSVDDSSCVKLMGEADSGKFSGETDFLSAKNTEPNAIGAKTLVSRSTADVILLMTDGVADDYFPAVPMMERLYLDLALNGIIPMKGELMQSEDPAPIRFRSVSMGRQSVALQYAKQLLSENTPQEMNALWEKRGALRCHSLEAFGITLGKTREERLRIWLDNYNERGSFDDRTLVIIESGGN